MIGYVNILNGFLNLIYNEINLNKDIVLIVYL